MRNSILHSYMIFAKNKKSIILLWCLLAVVLVIPIAGCASFSNIMISKHKINLTPKSISELSGSYQFFPDLEYSENGMAHPVKYRGKTKQFHQYIIPNKIGYDTTLNLLVVIKTIENDKVRLYFKKDNAVLDSITLKARLRFNGLLVLGNKGLQVHGIPLIIGDYESERIRIGLAKDGGLILQYAFEKAGALLLIIGSASNYNNAFHFRRISQDN